MIHFILSPRWIDGSTIRSDAGLEDQRVRMVFVGGHEVVAVLISATQDLDGSQHLIYEKVDPTNDPRGIGVEGAVFHAEGQLLLTIAAAEAA